MFVFENNNEATFIFDDSKQCGLIMCSHIQRATSSKFDELLLSQQIGNKPSVNNRLPQRRETLKRDTM